MGNVAKVIWHVNDQIQQDILMAKLSDEGFYAFEENQNSLSAYIKQEDINNSFIQNTSKESGCAFDIEIIQEKNWNENWESDFKKVIVNDFACIRADFHKPEPQVKYDLLITPKMSFGTGHHATTFLMVQQMALLDLKNKTVFDYGTGTGVLAILAEKMGATVTAIDLDEWSITNTLENINANESKNISVYKSENPPQDAAYDIVLANINTNVLVEKCLKIKSVLNKNGMLLISGFLTRDLNEIKSSFQSHGFEIVSEVEKEDWNCICFKN